MTVNLELISPLNYASCLYCLVFAAVKSALIVPTTKSYLKNDGYKSIYFQKQEISFRDQPGLYPNLLELKLK